MGRTIKEIKTEISKAYAGLSITWSALAATTFASIKDALRDSSLAAYKVPIEHLGYIIVAVEITTAALCALKSIRRKETTTTE